MDGDNPIRVFILDDHEMVRRGLRECLSAEDGIEVVGEAATAEVAVSMVPRLGVDVAVLDVRLRLPGSSGVEACREIRTASPGTACLMLTGHADDKALLASILAGAVGYVTKQGFGDELVEAVRTVAAGQSVLSPEATWRVMEQLQALMADGTADTLSTEEQQVLVLIEEGLTNPEIAAEMALPEQAVRDCVASLLAIAGI